METLESYLAGEWRRGDASGNATLVNPATEAAIAETSSKGLDLRAALEYGRNVGGTNLRAMTFAERGAVLKAMSKALYDARDVLLDDSTANNGATRSDGKFDVDGATGTLAYYAAIGAKLGDAKVLADGEGEQLLRSPRYFGRHMRSSLRGVAVHINAFNFPAWGTFEKAAVSILAGVPVLTKPATSTALTAFRAMKILVDAKVVPEGAMQFLCGGAGDLLSHMGSQDVLAFTGGASTGRMLRSHENLVAKSVRVNVEADSLNASILGADVEPGSETWNMFLRDVAKEITQKTGQKCTATRRLFVPASRIDDIQEELSARLGEIKTGDPSLEEVRMGPLATAQQLRDFRAGIGLLVESGAKVVFGDASKCDAIGAKDGKGYFVAPMLLRANDAKGARAVHEHEVFGPSSTLMPYDSAAEAAELVALGEGSLLTSLYADERESVKTLAREVAPYTGRLFLGSAKIAEQASPPGAVLPSCIHGGPGRAGGGEELGGERGLGFYMQRTALQGDRAVLDAIVGV